jgi:chaperonin GroES
MEPEFDNGLLMEEDQPRVSPEQFVQVTTASQNLAAEMDEEQLGSISQQVLSDYETDKESMAEWLGRMEKGLALAQLVKEDKTYPFEKAANVKYPLVTSAALQFNARAYPAIVPSDRVVKAKVWGSDKRGLKAARADRISEHMSWQLTAQVEEWEADTDKLLAILPITGSMFRKWWYDPGSKRPRCRLVEPGKLIVNDKVKALADAPRCTEEFSLYPNEIQTRERQGMFRAIDYTMDSEDAQAPEEFIEQHTRLDLDEDDYAEPYVVTVHAKSKQVVRVVADYRPEDVSYSTEQQMVPVMVPTMGPMGQPVPMMQMQPQEAVTGIEEIRRGSYFVAFDFMPSLDGGFHGTGLGVLLGDISESINTIINMLLDAGHFASLGGGFIGSEFRIKGGAQRHRPGEWKMVAATGNDVRSAIVPLTFPGPDATLFQLLGMLIDAGREIASVKDVMTGDAPRQNQTATATLALIEQGMMVFTAAYKRIFRSLKHEYRLLARINAETVSAEEYNAFHDEVDPNGQPVMFDPRQDYGAADMDIQPVADPRSVTKMQEAAKAQLVMELADKGMADRNEAVVRITQAMDIEDVEELLPKPDPMQAQLMQMQAAVGQAELVQRRADIELTLAKIEGERAKATKNMADAEATAMGSKIDAIRMKLEDERDRLDLVLQGARGMAGTPGNGGSAQGNGPNAGAPSAGDLQALLGGQAGPGGGSGGAGLGQGMGGGLL